MTNLANASAVIYHGLRSLAHFQKKPVNWAGFYVTSKENERLLILGPFQGKVSVILKTELFAKGKCRRKRKRGAFVFPSVTSL